MEKATKTSQAAKQPNSYGKKQAARWTEKAALVKTPVNMAWIGL